MFRLAALGLYFLCQGDGELLYARRRRLAVQLRVVGSLVFLPLVFVFFAAQTYSYWDTWVEKSMLALMVVLLAATLLSRLRTRLGGGVGGARGESC